MGVTGGTHKRDLDLGELEKEWEVVVSAAYYEHHLAVDDDFLPTLDLSPISLKSDLEHYVPDGGTVMFDKGVWNYLADGGWSATEETIPPTLGKPVIGNVGAKSKESKPRSRTILGGSPEASGL